MLKGAADQLSKQRDGGMVNEEVHQCFGFVNNPRKLKAEAAPK